MNTEYQYTIFKDDYGKYKIGVKRKNKNGEWEKAYFPVKFRKGVELENKTKIYIRDYWLDFYNWEHEGKKGTSFYIFINKFETTEETIEKSKEESSTNSIKLEDIELEDDDYPF